MTGRWAFEGGVSYRKKICCAKSALFHLVKHCHSIGGGRVVYGYSLCKNFTLHIVQKTIVYSDTIYTVKHSQNKKISNTPIGGWGQIQRGFEFVGSDPHPYVVLLI